MRKLQFKKGFGLIEIVVSTSIISVAFLGLMSVANLSLKVLQKSSNNIKAGFLMEEGVEAIKIIRDDGWNNISSLSNGVNYYFDFDGISWTATTTSSYIDDIFERKFILNNVERDANDDIVVSGANDPNTKKITIYVSWKENNGITTQSFSTYITNLFD
ncbi:prepilin-type N-terminal cleavage/methylation domain-containing protein [Patescibacteria group bacterium]|nr:prepilin-type N-terminal cleavage/methylation domain-containing protein [Patescibacteria group bacterium]